MYINFQWILEQQENSRRLREVWKCASIQWNEQEHLGNHRAVGLMRVVGKIMDKRVHVFKGLKDRRIINVSQHDVWYSYLEAIMGMDVCVVGGY